MKRKHELNPEVRIRGKKSCAKAQIQKDACVGQEVEKGQRGYSIVRKVEFGIG